jgi:hypothetical protein
VTASAAGRCLADADLFPWEIAELLIVARAELDRRVNKCGRCQACEAPFPCQRPPIVALTSIDSSGQSAPGSHLYLV